MNLKILKFKLKFKIKNQLPNIDEKAASGQR
jgi:hypothetical protein